jgi:subtilisin-like proprotein convertase family protein/endonuclease/exonuclease/phosphatase family metal-dependent hydrolase
MRRSPEPARRKAARDVRPPRRRGRGLAVESLEPRALLAQLVGFDVSGQTDFGTSPLAPGVLATGLTSITGLTRGAGVSTSGGAAGRAWGGASWDQSSAAAAVTGNDTATFSFQVGAGKTASLDDVTLSYRRSNAGAPSGQWAYSINSGAFTDIGAAQSFTSTASSGATLPAVNLTGVAGLQNLAAGTTVTFRLANYGGTTGTWYVYDVGNSTAADLVVNGTVADSGATVVVPSAPAITAITAGDTSLSVAFTAPSALGGAPITNYEYSVNDGATWTTPSPAVTSSPLVITGLVNNTAHPVRLRAVNSAGSGAASAAVTATPRGTGNLRVVNYNIAHAELSTPRAGLTTLFAAMGTESYNGLADRVDLFTLQEVQSQATTSAAIAAELNAHYGITTYATGTINGATTGNGTQGVVYDTASLTLLDEKTVGTASASGAPRQTMRYRFQPTAGDAASSFYVYVSHLKAADDPDSANRRALEVQDVRADADALGQGTSIIYVGDFNLQTSSEAAYQGFLAAGNGQAFDPVSRPGAWSGSSSFRDIFTQAPSANPPSGFGGGGLDDRYDFQLVSGELFGTGGLAYRAGSYRTFGNNGSVSMNGSINDPGSTALPGLSNRTQVLDLLTTVSDHLPVVADYTYVITAPPVTPTLAVSPGTLAAPLTTTAGTASAAQTITVSGSGLTGAVTVTAPTGLEVSLASGSGYGATLSLTPASGTLASTTVYVRLAASATAGSYNSAAITVSGGGATLVSVSTTASGNTVTAPNTVALLSEDFATLTAGGNTASSGTGSPSSTEVTSNLTSNFPTSVRAYSAGGAVKLGTSSAAGSITSRTLDLTGNGGAFTVSFDVKGWSTVEGSITVTVTGLAAQTVTYSATMSGAFESKTLSFTGGQANATITIATTARRAFLDNIVVTGGTPAPPVGASIAGFAWNDADGDGTWELPAETAAAGWTIYLDLDRDGQLDAAEPSTITASDGAYSFTDLAAGTYTVAQVPQAGWTQTFPALAGGAAARTAAFTTTQNVTVGTPSAPALRQQQKRFIPNDPLFAQQWHLRNTGQATGATSGEDANLPAAWDVARGTGVVIGVVDDGLQYTHPDLSTNYRADLSYDFNGNDADPQPGTGDDHGTAAAGVAAATGNNGIGVSGSAPNASLAGIRLISAITTDQQEASGLTYKPQDIAIYSNSWGPDDDGFTLEGPGPLTLAALKNAVTTGRGGLGSIYVWAAGNGLEANDNSNYDGYANSRYTIAVTAVDGAGKQSYYAEPGANILVAAPSSGTPGGTSLGITTADRTGTAGYNVSAASSPGNLSDRNYTNDFGGTSSATPLVSGVVALMLQANPSLTWRDVQHVLVNSARKNDVFDADWSQNSAGRWVNHKYGFGVVDAAAAVNLAQTWTTVAPEVSATSGTITVGQTIPDNNTSGLTSSFTIGADISAESVEVVFSSTHARRGDLQVTLTSPTGTSSVLAEKHADTGDNYSGWTFSTVRNWGESSLGTWTINVSDRTSGTTGTLDSWAINVYGTPRATLSGTHTVPVAPGQAVTAVNFGNEATPPPPVTVTGVYVRGSAWNTAYLDLTPFTTVGTDRLGWQLPDGAAQVANASTVSWNNVNTVSVRFDQPIALPAASALTLVRGTSGGNVAITPTAVSLLAGGTVAQWTLPSSLVTGKYYVSIASTAITDAAATTTLDGEWTTSSTTFVTGSGNGTAGGIFNFLFNVLVGDMNANGNANSNDISNQRSNIIVTLGTLPSATTFRFDINGNNSINSTDVSQARSSLASALGTPLTSLTAPTAPVELTPTAGPAAAGSDGLPSEASLAVWAWYASIEPARKK